MFQRNNMENSKIKMKAYFHLPGLFEFYEFYKVFLPLYRTHPEYFFDLSPVGHTNNTFLSLGKGSPLLTKSSKNTSVIFIESFISQSNSKKHIFKLYLYRAVHFFIFSEYRYINESNANNSTKFIKF